MTGQRWAWFAPADDDTDDDPPDVALTVLQLRLWAIRLELASLYRCLEDAMPNPPPRTRATVAAELAAARAELARLRPLAEADGAKHRESVARRDRIAWAVQTRVRAGDVSPEDAPGMLPAIVAEDADLQRSYHRAHYAVARLEDELKTHGAHAHV